MSLPAFEDGLLPPGRHATVDEVCEALVTGLPSSTTQAAIFSFCQDRRTAGGEWLDGSFATDKRDPADVDLITIIGGSGRNGVVVSGARRRPPVRP